MTEIERQLLTRLSPEWTPIGRAWVTPAQSLRGKGLVESRHVFPSCLGWKLTAQGIEAQRTDTP